MKNQPSHLIDKPFRLKILLTIRTQNRFKIHSIRLDMGEAKRRKLILGSTYGTQKTVTNEIQIAKKKNDARLPSDFSPDFGLEVAAQIGEQPFHLTVLDIGSINSLSDGKKTTTSLVPLAIQIKKITEDSILPNVTRLTMMAVEFYDPNMSLVDTVISALTSGVEVKANWSKHFFTRNPICRELIVPIHIMPHEETRLGLKHIANYI